MCSFQLKIVVYTRIPYVVEHSNVVAMQSFYLDKFGPGVVEIVKDSNVVEREKLDSSKVC